MSSHDRTTSRNIRRALLMDAVSQVLDNRVFRILAALSALIVLATFVVGFREDSVWILFGWREYFYDEVFDFFGMPLPIGGPAQQQAAITFVQNLFVDYLAGSLGLIFCVGATAFFVPQLLERGFADSFFSKPVSRWRLLLSRYVASIFFIAILATFLVVGMHLGLQVASDFSDPGFLWSALTLVYTFALLSSFTVLFGTLTRSTTAALLLTLVAFGVTSGVHNGWILLWYTQNSPIQAEIERAREEGRVGETADVFERVLSRTLSTAHHVLPKTTDAKYITAKLRDRLVSERDEEGSRRRRGREEPDDSAQPEFENPFAAYERSLSWGGPLATNLTWSVLSSLAWVAAALGMAWLRLRRISF